MTSTAPLGVFSDFPSSFKGPIHRLGDEGYDEIRMLWNRRGDQQLPALIVRATDAEDVRIAVDYAVGKDVSVAVRSGGHGIECYAMPHEALVVDMSLMKHIAVDPDTGRTTVQAGVLQGEMNAATQEYGYVVPAGTVSQVGVSGFTLGGGVGHLTRRFGATVDNLISIDVVTMDGRILTASADENEELFWGLRGAGQNLAIATAFTYATHRVGPEVISGNMIFGPADAALVLSGLSDALAGSPRELSVSPVVRTAPPLPGVPAEIVGQPIVLAMVVYTGPIDEFDSAMREIRRLPAPMIEMIGPTTWLSTTSAIDVWMPAGRRWYNSGGYLADITEEVARIVLDSVVDAPPDCELHLPVLGGALHDYSENSAAFSRAGANWMYEVTAQWDSAEDDAEYIAWVESTGDQLAPHTLVNGYVNLNPDRGPAGLRALYGSAEKWSRILALKEVWDPDNRLSHNKNVRPLAED